MYIGSALSSLSVVLIKNYGWRLTYSILSLCCLLCGFICLLLVKEKKSEQEIVVEEKDDENDEASFKALFNNPVNKFVISGAFIRIFGESIITYYLPVFFLKNFPYYKSQYSYINSAILLSAVFSNILAGTIGDLFEKKNYRTKSFICMFGGLISFPLIAIATLQTNNFWLSMGCFSIMMFFSSSYTG